jgi:hypothetical protein
VTDFTGYWQFAASPGIRDDSSMDFAQFDGNIVEPIDIRKNGRIM